jgi:hypothetical protein
MPGAAAVSLVAASVATPAAVFMKSLLFTLRLFPYLVKQMAVRTLFANCSYTVGD